MLLAAEKLFHSSISTCSNLAWVVSQASPSQGIVGRNLPASPASPAVVVAQEAHGHMVGQRKGLHGRVHVEVERPRKHQVLVADSVAVDDGQVPGVEE